MSDTRYLDVPKFLCSLVSRSAADRRRFPWKRVQRYNLFPNRQNFFSIIFCPATPPGGQPARCVLNFFSQHPTNPPKSPRKRQKKSFFPHVFGVAQVYFSRISLYIIVIVYFKCFQITMQQTGWIRYHSVPQYLAQIFAVGGEKRLFCPHTGKPVVRHYSCAHPRTQHHGLGSIPIRVGGRLGGIHGHTAAWWKTVIWKKWCIFAPDFWRNTARFIRIKYL